MFKKIASLSFIAGISAILTFFLNFILARFYSVEVFALYGSIFAVINIATIFTTIGYESLILRFSSESNLYDLLKSSLVSFLIASTFVTIIITCIFIFFYKISVYESLAWASLAPLLGFSVLRVSFYVNNNLQYKAQLIEKLLKTILCVFFIFISCYVLKQESSLSVSLSFLSANLIVFFISSYYVKKQLGSNFDLKIDNYILPSWVLFFIALVVVFQANLDILIISYFESEIDLALFLVAQKLSLASNIVILTVNTVLVPYILKNKTESEVKKNLSVGLNISVFASFVFFIVCYLFGREILSLFGNQYAEGEGVLNLIAASLLLSVIFGQTFTLMKTWGYEKHLLLFISISIFLKLFIIIVFNDYFILRHYVIVSIFCTLTWNVMCLIYIKNKTGINPSIFKMRSSNEK